MRYNLEFRKLTFYGLTRPQSIRKSKQISGQTILSSPQDLEFNPNFAKNRDIPVVKNSVTRPVTPAVLTTEHSIHSSIQSILQLSIHLSYLEEAFCLDTIYSVELPNSSFFERLRQDVDRAQRKQTLNEYSGVFYYFKHPSKGINTLNVRRG